MTSKEALSQLLCHATLDYNYFEPLEYIDLKRHYAEVISKLAKDLEVLEILKDKLPHVTILRVMECEGTYELYNDINCTSITKEEYELLKEWLKKWQVKD